MGMSNIDINDIEQSLDDQVIVGSDCHDEGTEDILNDDETAKEDQFNSDAEADADVLASAGMGTDEDYGCFGGGDDF
jgi:hypothetical protein